MSPLLAKINKKFTPNRFMCTKHKRNNVNQIINIIQKSPNRFMKKYPHIHITVLHETTLCKINKKFTPNRFMCTKHTRNNVNQIINIIIYKYIYRININNCNIILPKLLHHRTKYKEQLGTSWQWLYSSLQLSVQSVPITTKLWVRIPLMAR
jgi:hypothetical protein